MRSYGDLRDMEIIIKEKIFCKMACFMGLLTFLENAEIKKLTQYTPP